MLPSPDEEQQRSDQIALHFYTKLFHVVYQARAFPGELYQEARTKIDQWFNLEIPDSDLFPRELSEIYKSLSSILATSDYLRPSPPLHIHVLLVVPESSDDEVLVTLSQSNTPQHKSTSRVLIDPTPRYVLLETWKMQFTPNPDPAQLHPPADVTLPTVYKHAIPLFRSLYTLLRILPTWKLFKKLRRRTNFAAQFSIQLRATEGGDDGWFTGHDERTGGGRLGFDKPPTTGHPPLPTLTHVFPSIPHPLGSFTLSTTYLESPTFQLDDLEYLLSSKLISLDEGGFVPTLSSAYNKQQRTQRHRRELIVDRFVISSPSSSSSTNPGGQGHFSHVQQPSFHQHHRHRSDSHSSANSSLPSRRTSLDSLPSLPPISPSPPSTTFEPDDLKYLLSSKFTSSDEGGFVPTTYNPGNKQQTIQIHPHELIANRFVISSPSVSSSTNPGQGQGHFSHVRQPSLPQHHHHRSDSYSSANSSLPSRRISLDSLPSIPSIPSLPPISPSPPPTTTQDTLIKRPNTINPFRANTLLPASGGWTSTSLGAGGGGVGGQPGSAGSIHSRKLFRSPQHSQPLSFLTSGSSGKLAPPTSSPGPTFQKSSVSGFGSGSGQGTTGGPGAEIGLPSHRRRYPSSFTHMYTRSVSVGSAGSDGREGKWPEVIPISIPESSSSVMDAIGGSPARSTEIDGGGGSSSSSLAPRTVDEKSNSRSSSFLGKRTEDNDISLFMQDMKMRKPLSGSWGMEVGSGANGEGRRQGAHIESGSSAASEGTIRDDRTVGGPDLGEDGDDEEEGDGEGDGEDEEELGSTKQRYSHPNQLSRRSRLNPSRHYYANPRMKTTTQQQTTIPNDTTSSGSSARPNTIGCEPSLTFPPGAMPTSQDEVGVRLKKINEAFLKSLTGLGWSGQGFVDKGDKEEGDGKERSTMQQQTTTTRRHATPNMDTDTDTMSSSSSAKPNTTGGCGPSSASSPDLLDPELYKAYLCRVLNIESADVIDFTGHIDRDQTQFIAAGGSGEVYKALWKGLDKNRLIGTPKALPMVVVKLIRLPPIRDDVGKRKRYKRMKRELELWSKLSHPHILPLIGIARIQGDANLPAFISPWMENGNVMEFLRQNPSLPASVLQEIIKGLHYLHNYNPVIVHGDLKGANVLINHRKEACLADFGLSRFVVDNTLWRTTATHANGTLRWMAPELIEGDVIVPTIATDIYAYGMTCYEMISRGSPFADANDAVVISKVIKGKRPKRVESCHSDEIWSIITRCWAQEPKDRPSTETLQLVLQHDIPPTL